MNYEAQYEKYLKIAQDELKLASEKVFMNNGDSEVVNAALYSLMAGGKRVRAVLCIAVCDMLGGNLKLAAQYASAVEMLHCYSLIHDDLPCMDNDDFRRGKPSCHKKYGEATALLAGDALLTAAFEVLCTSNNGTQAQNVDACKYLSTAAGAKGMIYGQELDLRFENIIASEKQLFEIHKNKTGKLIDAAAMLGVIASTCSDEKHKAAISEFAFNTGLVFQIIDDVLDVTANEKILGKPVGSDDKSGKTTYVKLFGLEQSFKLAEDYTNKTCEMLIYNFGTNADFLAQFSKQMLCRNN